MCEKDIAQNDWDDIFVLLATNLDWYMEGDDERLLYVKQNGLSFLIKSVDKNQAFSYAYKISICREDITSLHTNESLDWSK